MTQGEGKNQGGQGKGQQQKKKGALNVIDQSIVDR